LTLSNKSKSQSFVMAHNEDSPIVEPIQEGRLKRGITEMITSANVSKDTRGISGAGEGKIRGLSQVRRMTSGSKKEDIAIMLGNSQTPKPRTREHNVRKEKEEALLYIRTETKKYD
jgi:hypothetical protein